MKRLLAGTAALGAAFALNVLPAAAQTETYPPPTSPPTTVVTTPPPSVGGTTQTPPTSPTRSVSRVGGRSLPVTGGDMVGIAGIGGAAMAAGAALLAVRRRRESAVRA